MTVARLVMAVLVGIILGLFLTIHALDRSNLGLATGPWRGVPRNGTGESDPYVLAATARSSLLPLGSAEGLSFTADRDSAGSRLTSDCDYAVKGPMPPSRFWTLSLLSPDGFPVADPANRYGFTSSEVLRMMDEPVTINVSRQARSGNWLPAGEKRSYVLLLRLYDTGLSTIGANLTVAAMPKIERLSCR